VRALVMRRAAARPAQTLATASLRPLLLALVALILFRWHIGPVVLILTATHGVHLGDSLAALPALAAALPHRRLRLDRRLGVVQPLSPNPMRRASDREGPGPDPGTEGIV